MVVPGPWPCSRRPCRRRRRGCSHSKPLLSSSSPSPSSWGRRCLELPADEPPPVHELDARRDGGSPPACCAAVASSARRSSNSAPSTSPTRPCFWLAREAGQLVVDRSRPARSRPPPTAVLSIACSSRGNHRSCVDGRRVVPLVIPSGSAPRRRRGVAFDQRAVTSWWTTTWLSSL